MQDAAADATNVLTKNQNTGDAGPVDAADTTYDVAAGSQATAQPVAQARQSLHSSTAEAEGGVTHDSHSQHGLAVSVRELQPSITCVLRAVPESGSVVAADIPGVPQPTDHQDDLISDSESERPPPLSSQAASCLVDVHVSGQNISSLQQGTDSHLGMAREGGHSDAATALPNSMPQVLPSSVNDAAAAVHSSPTPIMEADDIAVPPTGPGQALQQQHRLSYDRRGGDTLAFPVADSSESLLQAEAEAARLALLLAPPVYRPPAQAHQLAQMGTGVPVENPGTGSIQASLHAQFGTVQAVGMMADDALPTNVQSRDCKLGTAEADSADTVQRLPAAEGLPTSLQSAQRLGHSKQESTLQEPAKVAPSSGLQQLALQVNQQRLKTCGDPETGSERPVARPKQECAVALEEDAADVVIPDR